MNKRRESVCFTLYHIFDNSIEKPSCVDKKRVSDIVEKYRGHKFYGIRVPSIEAIPPKIDKIMLAIEW